MRYGWLIPLAALMMSGAVAAGWFWGQRRLRAKNSWIANSGYVRNLPAFTRRVARARVGMILAAVTGLVLLLPLSLLAGQPVERRTESEVLASRDIVLCLDVSGSMFATDAQILEKFGELVDHFQGERVALVIWNTSARTIFPLTDDYSMVRETLQDSARIMTDGVLEKTDTGFLITPELRDFLTGTIITGVEDSSVIGDGLASCTRAFDDRDTDATRSRSILLASDNEVAGKGIYTLEQATVLAEKKNTKVDGLFACDPDQLGIPGVVPCSGKDEFERIVTSHDGHFYDVSDNDAVARILQEIQSRQVTEIKGEGKVRVTDIPEGYYPWLVVGVLALVIIRWRGRI